MTAQPTSNPTTQPALTATQARALLQTLLSTAPTSNATQRPATNPAAPKPANIRSSRQSHQQQQPTQTHTITIDASTRIMGHCNNIHLSSLSATEQAARIDELVRGALEGVSKGSGAVHVSVNAGVNVMGSKNVFVLGAPAARNEESSGTRLATAPSESVVGTKRRAEDCVESGQGAGKKVKLEEGLKEGA